MIHSLPPFQVTHRHVETDNGYQLIARVRIRQRPKQWAWGMLYQDGSGNLFVRSERSFKERFKVEFTKTDERWT